MSRSELAEAVCAWLWESTRVRYELDGHYLSKLERGVVRWPGSGYRSGLRHVLQVATDAELGFWPTGRAKTVPVQIDPGDLSAVGVPADVVPIRVMAQALQAADRQVGGGMLYGTVIRYLNTELAPRLMEVTAASAAAVFAAASSLTEIAGWMAHDSGRDDDARDHFDRAFRLATAAESPAAAANVCASLSHLAGQLGQPGDAVRMAEAGIERARRAQGTTCLVARLHMMRARGLAMQQDSVGCAKALVNAERVLRDADGECPAEWIADFDEASLAGESALCLRGLGNFGEAEARARRAIELRGRDRVRSRAFAQLTLARVLADAGRLDEAAEVGREVVAVASSLTSSRVRQRLDRLGDVLSSHRRVPGVGGFLSGLVSLRQGTNGRASWPV